MQLPYFVIMAFMLWIPPIAVGLLFIARLFELKYRFPASSGRIEAPRTFQALTLVGSLAVVSALLEYILRASIGSLWLVGAGVTLWLAGFALRATARRALGKMWSVHVEIRDQHVLVDSGPYRFVRHPIYVAAVLELVAAPVALGAWSTGAVSLVLYLVALSFRVRAEERAHQRHHGQKWVDYCKRTPAFFPRW